MYSGISLCRCESNYCSMLNIVGEYMFMEVDVRAMIELWDVVFAMTFSRY